MEEGEGLRLGECEEEQEEGEEESGGRGKVICADQGNLTLINSRERLGLEICARCILSSHFFPSSLFLIKVSSCFPGSLLFIYFLFTFIIFFFS